MGYGGDYGAGALVTGINNIVTHFREKKAARKEWKHFKRRYQTMVADLKAAGLNPMLAYGASPGQPPSGEASGFSYQPMDFSGVSGAISARQQRQATALQMKNLRQQERLLEAQTDEAWSRSGQAAASTANTQANTRLTDLERTMQETLFPSSRALAEASAEAARLGLPALRNVAGEQESLSSVPSWLRLILKSAPLINRSLTVAPKGRVRYYMPGTAPGIGSGRRR